MVVIVVDVGVAAGVKLGRRFACRSRGEQNFVHINIWPRVHLD